MALFGTGLHCPVQSDDCPVHTIWCMTSQRQKLHPVLQRERERDFRLLQGPRPPRILSGPSSSDKDPLRSGNVHASIERPRLSGKKVVLKVELYDDKIKEKAMKAVSRLSGVESVSADREGHKMTIIGDVDPVSVVGKLRKLCRAEILSVGPAKEVKKEEAKKPEGKKKDPKEEYGEILEAYEGYYSQTRQPSPCYYYRPMEEDPKRCVIC